MNDNLRIPAICPYCRGALYIDLSDENDDDETVECVYCYKTIRIDEAIALYNEKAGKSRNTKLFNYDGGGTMSLTNLLDSETKTIDLDVIAGKEDIINIIFSNSVRMYFANGIPGIVWFDFTKTKEYEVLDYQWSGPNFQQVMIQKNDSNTRTKGGRKGRVAGAIIGTILMPGLGTVIGAAVGTGKKEVSNTSGQTVSHVETKEIPVPASMRLRNLSDDNIVNISFQCTSDLDARIRNNITTNLDQGYYIDFDTPEALPEPEPEKDTNDIITQLKELKSLLDDGAITQEEYDELKKKII